MEFGSGKELIFMRVINPTPGIWTIKVYGSNILNGEFNIWTNLRQYMVNDTYFLKPNPDTTLTVPSSATGVISVGDMIILPIVFTANPEGALQLTIE